MFLPETGTRQEDLYRFTEVQQTPQLSLGGEGCQPVTGVLCVPCCASVGPCIWSCLLLLLQYLLWNRPHPSEFRIASFLDSLACSVRVDAET